MNITKQMWDDLTDSVLGEEHAKRARETLAQEERARFLGSNSVHSHQEPVEHFKRFFEFGIQSCTDDYLRQLAIIGARAANVIEDIKRLDDHIEKIEQREQQLIERLAKTERIIHEQANEIEFLKRELNNS